VEELIMSFASKVMEALADTKISSVGFDYLRVTSKDDAGATWIAEEAQRLMGRQANGGDARKKGGMQGFQGVSCGPLFFGRKEALFMLQVSGPLADEVVPKMPKVGLNTTRLDVQVTVELGELCPQLAELLAYARREVVADRGKKMRPAQNLRLGFGKGDTLYIGSRVSPRFGRVYDKGAESKECPPGRVWRFETEFKGVVAPEVINYFAAAGYSPEAMMAVVKGQFAEWTIPVPVGGAGYLVAGSIGRREMDNDRSLGWLQAQVRPTIERLLGSISRAEIESALGLDVYRKPERNPTATKERLAQLERWNEDNEAYGSLPNPANKW
jgi:hypothetical protein